MNRPIAENPTLFSGLVQKGFQQRRKTLSNSLKHFLNSKQLQALDYDPKQRAENLSVDDWVTLSNHCHSIQQRLGKTEESSLQGIS